MQFLARLKLQSEGRVFEQEARAPCGRETRNLELSDEFDLVEAAIAANVIEEGLLEENDRRLLLAGHAAPVRLVAQSIHDGSTVYAFWTARRAGFARHALPD